MKLKVTGDKWQVAGRPSKFRGPSYHSAFTLIEAMVAIGVFFVAIFAILDVVMQNVKAAHSLNQLKPTAGMVAAELSMTNKLTEGSESGDFGDLYPDYSWTRDVVIYGTNGMFQVDIAVYKKERTGEREDSTLSILLFRPESEQHVGDGSAAKMQFGGRSPDRTGSSRR